MKGNKERDGIEGGTHAGYKQKQKTNVTASNQTSNRTAVHQTNVGEGNLSNMPLENQGACQKN